LNVRTALAGILVSIVALSAREGQSESQKGAPFRSEYDSLWTEAQDTDAIRTKRNIWGYLAWDESYLLESLLEMYRATGDTIYLNRFVERADVVIEVRDDQSGRADWKGRFRPGWSSNAQFTLGIPVTVPDDEGNPSLHIEGSARRDNNRTKLQILEDDEGMFAISVMNDKHRENDRVFRGLTMETVESVVNAVGPKDQLIRVVALGTHPPETPFSAGFDTHAMVNHGLDTPVISTPLAGFAALVLDDPDLSSYHDKAREYLGRIEESLADYAHTWMDEGDRGHYIFEPGEPLWRASLPLPYNGLSLQGELNLLLYRATGNEAYRMRALKLARRVKSGLTPTKAGHYEMKYAFGLAHDGWQDRPDLHFPSYPGVRFGEDLGHFSSTLRFIVDAYEAGLVFDNQDLDRLLATFTDVIFRDTTFNNSLRISSKGTGSYDSSAGIYVLLASYSSDIFEKCLTVFERSVKKENRKGILLLGWARFARLSSQMN
jgi:hypothetical protein